MSPGTTPSRADARANREALIEAGLRVLARDPDAGLAVVAAEAGVSRRTVYGHFANRAGLVEAIATHVAERLVARTTEVTEDPEPLVTLVRVVRVLGTDLAAYRNVGGLALRLGADRTVHEAARATGSSRVRALVEAAHAAGSVDTALSPAVLHTLMNATQQAVFEALVSGELTEDEAPEVAARAVLNTLGVPHPLREEVLTR